LSHRGRQIPTAASLYQSIPKHVLKPLSVKHSNNYTYDC
jgi:hypothetical protein